MGCGGERRTQLASRLLKKGFADFATFVPLEQGMGVAMRGDDQICGGLFSYIDLEARVETEHPLRAIREIANTALAALTDEFEALYSGLGRPSITTGKAAAGNAVAGLLFGALGAAIDGADQIRSAVPMVCRAWD